MNAFHLSFLGVPSMRRDDRLIELRRAKGTALLLYLAITRVAQPRERVLDLLWPESLPQAARKNMRNTLWAIGEALGDDLLLQDGHTLCLAPSVTVDIHTLEDGLLLLEGGGIAALERVAAHYRGPLADGLVIHEAPEFEIWLATERERMATVYLRLLERIIALQRAAGDWQSVITQTQRALAADPLREPIHLALIEAQLRLGQRAQAAQQYATLADLLQRELAVAPLPETTAHYKALLADASQRAAPLLPQTPRRQEPPSPFVGRQAELAALDEERAHAAQGAARVVLITGELGIGKTQLWRSWAATRAAEAVLLATHALGTGEPLPFGPLLTLFRQPGPARAIIQPPSPLAPIWLAELARLLPEIAESWPNLPPPLGLSPAEERARLFQALAEAIRLLAQPLERRSSIPIRERTRRHAKEEIASASLRAPSRVFADENEEIASASLRAPSRVFADETVADVLVVLAIDDLHWADSATLDGLLYLIDHLRHTPLLLIGTYRPQEAHERLLAAAAGWQRQGLLRQIALPHLTSAEAYALLDAPGTPYPHNLARHWVEQSGGNAYFLLELRRALGSDPPGDLAALVRARVQATVPSSAIQVLQAAAVLGDGAEFATLRATSGRSEEETLDALDALVAAVVLVAQDGSYRFVHPLVATVVRQDLTPMRRAFLHRRAAQALERAYAPRPDRVAGQLMEHLAAAGEHERAAHYAERAATQALAVGAFVEAVAYAQRALDWEPTAQRQLLLGETLWTAGDASTAQAQLEAALRGHEAADDPVGATRASMMLAQLAISKSQPADARAWLERAPIARVQATEPALGIQAHLLAAAVARQSQAYEAAEAQLDQAAQLIRQQQLPLLATPILFERGNLLANRGDLRAALDAFGEALRLAQAAANPAFEVMARNNLAYHSLLVGDLASAQEHIRTARELMERYGLSFLRQYVHSTAGEIALAQGRLDTADSAFASALEAARAWDNRVHMANVHASQAMVARARGDQAQARAQLAEARERFGDAIDPFVRDKIVRAEEMLKDERR